MATVLEHQRVIGDKYRNKRSEEIIDIGDGVKILRKLNKFTGEEEDFEMIPCPYCGETEFWKKAYGEHDEPKRRCKNCRKYYKLYIYQIIEEVPHIMNKAFKHLNEHN